MRFEPRYSLRAFLLLVTLCVMAFGLVHVIWLRPFRQEYAAIKHFQKLGGHVTSTLREPRWPWQHLGEAFAIEAFSLTLTDIDLKDADLEPISAMANLRVLNVNGGSLTDTGLAYIEGCRQLRSLGLRHTRIARPPKLAGITKLQDLDLAFTEIRTIDLSGLVALENIKVRGTLVSDESLDTFANLPKLKIIDIAGRPDRSMHITDAGLDRLTNLPCLSTIYLYNTETTAESITRLRQRFPTIAVFRSPKTTYAAKSVDEED